MLDQEPLGRDYVLHEELGQGAFGVLRRASRHDGGPGLAAELLRQDLADDQRVRNLFLQEEAVLRNLRHEAIVGLWEVVFEPGRLALLLDLVDGPDLRRYLADAGGTLPAADACAIAAQLAAGLAVAHAQGVLHLDLKPENILVERNSQPAKVKITEFGVAALLLDAGRDRASLGGIPGYLAPEVLAAGAATTAADVFAIGVILVEMVTGGRLDARTAEAWAGMAEELRSLVRECLDHHPQDRPSARALAARLRAAVPALSGTPAVVSAPAPTTVPVPPTVPVPVPPTVPGPPAVPGPSAVPVPPAPVPSPAPVAPTVPVPPGVPAAPTVPVPLAVSVPPAAPVPPAVHGAPTAPVAPDQAVAPAVPVPSPVPVAPAAPSAAGVPGLAAAGSVPVQPTAVASGSPATTGFQTDPQPPPPDPGGTTFLWATDESDHARTVTPPTPIGPDIARTPSAVGKFLVPATVGAAVAVAVGAYGRLHSPSGIAVNIAGFSSALTVKVWLTTAVVLLAGLQVLSAMVMYGRLPGARSWTTAAHRWFGRAAFLLSVPVAVHCLYALGLQTFDARVLVHSLLGCVFYGAFTMKMLLLPRSGLASWMVPMAGGVVFAASIGLWLTSSLWFFATSGVQF